MGHRGTGGITYMSFARYSNSAFVNEKKRLLIVIPICIGERFSGVVDRIDLDFCNQIYSANP